MLLCVQPTEVQMLSTRDQEIVLARDRGETTVDLGARYGVSHQRITAVVSNANALVGQVSLDLMVARKTGEQCAYLIPYQPGYTHALDFGYWLIKQLREDGIQVDIETRRAHNGLAPLLTDVTPRRAT
jgi:hypothetical protein